jgi:hypothetical protein
MSKIKCMLCNEILESKHRHDYVVCSCDNRTVLDGGNDYLKLGGRDLSKIFIIEANGEEVNKLLKLSEDVPNNYKNE